MFSNALLIYQRNKSDVLKQNLVKKCKYLVKTIAKNKKICYSLFVKKMLAGA